MPKQILPLFLALFFPFPLFAFGSEAIPPNEGQAMTQLVDALPHEPPGRPIAPHPQSAILFVPGFFGTALADVTTGERRFLTLTESLFGSTPFPLHGAELGFSHYAELKTDGVLESVPIISHIYSIDAYGTALDFLKKEFRNQATIIPFAYDWRQDIYTSAVELSHQVKSLKAQGYTSISIVAHSMGGLIASYYLRYGEQDFGNELPRETWEGAREVQSFVLAGSPFHGLTSVFKDMQLGIHFGLNSVALGPDAYATFASAYELLEEGPAIDTGIYETNHWENSQWGLFATASSTNRKIRQDYTDSMLKRAQAFHRAILAPGRAQPPMLPILWITGHGFSTLARATDDWNVELGQGGADGDGTVTVSSAQLPEVWMEQLHPQHLDLTLSHRGMYAQPEVQSAVRKFFRGFTSAR